MKKTTTIISALFILMCAVSCQKENGQEDVIKGKEIKIEQGTVLPTKSTPASTVKEEVLFTMPIVTDNGDTLSLVASISDMTDAPAPETCLTKGAPVTTENLGDLYKSFKTTVYKGGSLYTDGLGKTMDGVTVTYGADGWSLVGSPYRWPDGNDDLVFCSYAPISAAGVSGLSWNGGTKVSFNYVNEPLGRSSEDQAFHDAQNQTDIIFAINEQSSEDHDGTAMINFSHALVGVRFIKGDIQDCTLRRVMLKNFYSQGSAEGTLNADGNLDFEWTPSGNLKNFSQSFSGSKNVNMIEDKATMDPTEDGSYTFLMIPQALDASALVELYLNYGGNSYQYLPLNLGSITAEQAGSEANAAKLKDWSTYAGKVITIRINRADLAVAVDETFDGSVKADVGAKNIGGKIEFVRAAIVANWVDKDGNICENCDFVNDVALEGYLGEGCNWAYNSADGFYYYSKAIVPGAVTQGKIFTSYTAPKAPEDGLHLEMAVVVQGVEYDSSCAKAKASWNVPDGFLTSEIEYKTSGE